MEKRKRGRPRKEQGRIAFWQFKRTCLVLAAYNDARHSGEKHAAAVTETVHLIKEHHPEMKISETEVRRVLAVWQPRTDEIVLRVEASPATQENVERWRRLLEQVPAIQHSGALPFAQDATRPRHPRIIKFGFAKRPDYLRHNRKDQPDRPVNN